jgi:hypothetical protein
MPLTIGMMIDQLVTVNNKIWAAEDIAHEPGADDTAVANAKRKINALNNQRNDLIQEIDEYFEKALSGEIRHKAFPQFKDYGRKKK